MLTQLNMTKLSEEIISSIIHRKKILGKLNICSVTQPYMAVHKEGAWRGGLKHNPIR